MGDVEGGRLKARTARNLNIAGIIIGTIVIVAVVVSLVLLLKKDSNNSVVYTYG